jgi:opine dehydrogenase
MTNLPRIAVCGTGNAGLSIAGDCALKGMEVALFELDSLARRIRPIQDAGGIEISPASATTSGKTGFAALACATTDPGQAVAGAQVIMITVPAMYHSVFFDALAPHLRDGQIVLFNTSYWACLRHAGRLGALRARVVLAEANIMPYAAQRGADNGVHISRFKRRMSVASFPGNAGGYVFPVLKQIYSQFEQADSVLEVDIAAGGNPAMTVPMVVPVTGAYFDRNLGGKLYADATAMGSRLMKGYDADRRKLSAILGLANFETQLAYYTSAYATAGDDMAQIMRKSNLIDWWATSDYIKQLMDEDLLFSYVPMVRLAGSLGIDLAVTRAMVDIMGTMLDVDYWGSGVSLAEMNLEGLSLSQVKQYVMTGQCDR